MSKSRVAYNYSAKEQNAACYGEISENQLSKDRFAL
jgi:hypothetical protein